MTEENHVKQGEPMEPEVWLLDHPEHKKFKIAIKWLGPKDDGKFAESVLAHCLNGPLFGTRQNVNVHRFEHRIFRDNNWYATNQWLDHTEQGIVTKALDEHGITWDCGPAEKDPEKEFICGLKDNDLKFFRYPEKT